MSCLIDTCGWIEWFTDGILAEKYAPYFNEIESIIVPTSVQFELYKWVKRVKDEQSALEVVALTEQCQVFSLTTSTALLAADLSLAHQLSFADAIIYATAQNLGAQLITSDDHFEALNDVIFFPKKTGENR